MIENRIEFNPPQDPADWQNTFLAMLGTGLTISAHHPGTIDGVTDRNAEIMKVMQTLKDEDTTLSSPSNSSPWGDSSIVLYYQASEITRWRW